MGKLSNEYIRTATYTHKLNTILKAYEEDKRRIPRCIESTYYRNIISTLDSFVINCAVCLIVNIIHTIYVGTVYGIRKLKSDTILERDSLGIHASQNPRKRSNIHKRSTISLTTTKQIRPKRSSRWN